MFIKLKDRLGNNLENKKEDVIMVKRALNFLGKFDFASEPALHGYMTRPLHESILSFQKENRLRVDGKMFPKGETEKYINKYLKASENGHPVPKVEKGEVLPPPRPKNIPGTNIPDRGVPETGLYRRDPEIDKWRLMMDPNMEKIPPQFNMDRRMLLPYDKDDIRSPRWPDPHRERDL